MKMKTQSDQHCNVSPPKVRRGYTRKQDSETGKWLYEPRSGFGTFFLTSFTSFLAILVVLNICMGTGYRGYKAAVTGLYTITETVGTVISKVSTALGFVFFNGNDGKAEIEVRPDGGSDQTVYRVFRGSGQVWTSDDGKEVVLFSYSYVKSQNHDGYVIVYSTHPSFHVGDNVYHRWLFGYYFDNITTDETFIRGWKTIENITYDEYLTRYMSN